MKGRIVGSSGQIACRNCGNDRFEIPTDEWSDNLVSCGCGQVVGPYRSLVAFADNEGHTAVNAIIKPLT